MNWIATILGGINQYLKQLIAEQHKMERQLATVQDSQTVMQEDIAKILKFVSPLPAAGFELTIQNSQGEEQMAKPSVRGKLKIDVVDTGTLNGTLTVLDDAGI